MEKSHGFNPELLHFLKQPESYPHHPAEVRHIQTHISHVFMVPPFVYKIKKPVNFDFLDYSTLEKRHRFCHREVELNRRLCDGVYLGVVAIIKKEDGFSIIEGDVESDAVVEYAVKMKQLSEAHFLHTYIEQGSLNEEHLNRIAEKLADFYNRQQPNPQITKWGKVENIRVNTDENFRQTKEFIDQTINQNTFEAINSYTDRYFEQNKKLFKKRIKEGRIVDGHGDLHLEHIHITPGQVRIYDCIEFNDRFRYGDLAADLAYLAMDLDFNNCRRESRYFIQQMAKRLNDEGLLQIIDFYKCYRAYVKGKVKSLQSAEEEVERADREKASALARRYFDLSLRYALLGSKPTVLVMMGRVGTGKSTLAEYLAEKLNIRHFSSDCIRKELGNIPLTKRVSVDERAMLYSSEMSARTYQKLMDKARDFIKQEQSVILDATFSREDGRRQLIELSESVGADYIFVEVQASDEVIKKRLADRRTQENVVSDARLEDFEKLNKNYRAPVEISDDHSISVDSEQPLEGTVGELYAQLIARNTVS